MKRGLAGADHIVTCRGKRFDLSGMRVYASTKWLMGTAPEGRHKTMAERSDGKILRRAAMGTRTA